jgi:hypothetical protein
MPPRLGGVSERLCVDSQHPARTAQRADGMKRSARGAKGRGRSTASWPERGRSAGTR